MLGVRGRRPAEDSQLASSRAATSKRSPSDGLRSWWPALRCALAWALGVRVVALLVATGARWMLQQESTGPRPLGDWLSVWDRWDAANLAKIAEHGYLSTTVDPAYPGSATAFFPGFPLVVRATAWLLGGNRPLTGLVVSLVASVVAFAALYRLAEERVRPQAGPVAVALLACAPLGVFLVAGYSEALFLAGAIPAWYFASRDRWLLAGLTGAVAVATRAVGVLVVAGIATEYLVRRDVLGRLAGGRTPGQGRPWDLAVARGRLAALAGRVRGGNGGRTGQAVAGRGAPTGGTTGRTGEAAEQGGGRACGVNGGIGATSGRRPNGREPNGREPNGREPNGREPNGLRQGTGAAPNAAPGAAPPWRAVGGLVLAVTPLVVWMAWLYWRAGDPLQFVKDQRSGWGRELTDPVQAFQTTLRGALGNADTTWVFTWRLELVGAAIGLFLLGWCLLRREWGWSVYVGLTMAAYLLSTWYFSIPRGLLGLFPLPLLLAGVLRGRPQAFALTLATSASLFALGVAVFVRGPWVG